MALIPVREAEFRRDQSAVHAGRGWLHTTPFVASAPPAYRSVGSSSVHSGPGRSSLLETTIGVLALHDPPSAPQDHAAPRFRGMHATASALEQWTSPAALARAPGSLALRSCL
jgi:hypothetical protein